MGDTGYRLGVDIGGTFTDVVLLGEDGRLHTQKVLSTPHDYAEGVVEGARRVLDAAGIMASAVTGVVHATTVASNTVLEGRGAKTALVTTEGFRDVLEMRRLRIPVMYDLQYDKPAPLVPRRRRYEVAERMGPRGEVWRELDRESVTMVARAVAEEGVEAVAISLLNSYASSEHEHATADVLRGVLGSEVYLTCSSDILPEIREYERTSTAVVNAYVGPAVSRYVRSLALRLGEIGITAPLEIMQSGGGTMSPEAASERPAYLVESGPAAGVIACAQLASVTDQPNLISFDMGGTTAKAAMLEDGEAIRTSEYEIGAGINLSSRLVKGGGYAIKLPFIDVSEIGAGGGSIITVDELGGARVGPESAGAAPGPVSYGAGGVDPTLADALLVLGYLNPSKLAGGVVKLDVDAARRAVESRVAEPLGLSLLDAAHGVLAVAVATMTRAVKAVSTYRGRDPRDFALCAFGGNGPIVGVEIARALSMRKVLVPPAPGVYSAVGLLYSPSEYEFVRTLLVSAVDARAGELHGEFESLREEARNSLVQDGAVVDSASFARMADLRYSGQAYELSISVADGDVDPQRLIHDFVAEHERTYGHGSLDDPVDIVSIRIIARVERGPSAATLVAGSSAAVSNGETREAYFGPEVGSIDVPIMLREALRENSVDGPVFIDEYDSTTVVPPGCRAILDDFGSIAIHVD